MAKTSKKEIISVRNIAQAANEAEKSAKWHQAAQSWRRNGESRKMAKPQYIAIDKQQLKWRKRKKSAKQNINGKI